MIKGNLIKKFEDHSVIYTAKKENIFVDTEDVKLLSQYTWRINNGYAVSQVKDQATKKYNRIYMHRLLLNPLDDVLIDHMDTDRSNNRKQNLRLCNEVQNNSNRSKSNNNINNKFKRVRFREFLNAWEVQISANGKQYNIGTFSNELAGANAYNFYAKLIHGEFANLNEVEQMDNWSDYIVKNGKTSKFRGVTFDRGKWTAHVYDGNKVIYAGRFNTELEAGLAFNDKALELGLVFTKYNLIPEWFENNIENIKELI